MSPEADGAEGRGRDPAVHAATLYCESCGEETAHRLLRVSGGRGGAVRGLARCRICRTTRPFATGKAAPHAVYEILSDGRTSVRSLLDLDPNAELRLGEHVPGRESAARIHKIDLANGRPARVAAARDVRTIWVTPDVGAVVKVSLVEGRRTSSSRLTLEPTFSLEVGGTVEVEGRAWRVVALRAKGHTWKVPGDRFTASQIERVYARRNVSPPEGTNDWSRSRARPASRASSTSRVARSRSGPGVRR